MKLTLLLLLLLAGCATRGDVTKLAAQVEANRERGHISKQEILRLEHATGLLSDTEVKSWGGQSSRRMATCIDRRWGKCEKHGEWWIEAKREYIAASRIWIQARVTKGPISGDLIHEPGYWETLCRARWQVDLICPRGHYIEREIEGPKEKP